MPYESQYYRNTNSWPFYEYSKPRYVWEDDEFENNRGYGNINTAAGNNEKPLKFRKSE